MVKMKSSKPVKRGPVRGDPSFLSDKQRHFIDLILSGKNQQDAYVEAYTPLTKNMPSVAVLAHRVGRRPSVLKELRRLRDIASRKVVLSLTDRGKILSTIILDPDAKNNDRVQAISVYSRIFGDQAPEQHEHSGPNGGPIAVAAAVTTTPTVIRMTAAQRLKQLRDARAKRNAPTEVPLPVEDQLTNPS